jgi:hypothetical protein
MDEDNCFIDWEYNKTYTLSCDKPAKEIKETELQSFVDYVNDNKRANKICSEFTDELNNNHSRLKADRAEYRKSDELNVL